MKDFFLSLSTSNKKFFILIGIVLSTFFLININHKTSIDYNIIVYPLESISSFQDYIDAKKEGKIYDIQPVRDVSHLLDIYLSPNPKVNRKIGIVHNLILFFICSYLIFKILALLKIPKPNIGFFTLIFLIHPALYEVFIEITSRKHILALLFFLLCFLIFLKESRNKIVKSIKILITYGLSIFSHPIGIFAPYFFLFFKGFKNDLKNRILILLPSFLLSLYCAIINYQFYAIKYKEITNIEKVGGGFSLGKTILSIGIHVKQILFPVFFSQYYFNLHVTELIFFFLLLLLVYISYKKNKVIEIYYLFPFFSVMIILYHRQMDLIFLNTYVLIPLVSFIFFLSNFDIRPKLKAAIIACLLITTAYRSYIRNNDLRFFKSAYYNQPNCHQLQGFVSQISLSDTYNLDEVYFWVKQHINDECIMTNSTNEFLPYVFFTLAVFSNPDLNIDEKIERFQRRYHSGDVNLLHDALIIAKGMNKDRLKSDFNNYYYSILIAFIPGKIISRYCNERVDSYCNSFKEYKKKNEKVELELKLKSNLDRD